MTQLEEECVGIDKQLLERALQQGSHDLGDDGELAGDNTSNREVVFSSFVNVFVSVSVSLSLFSSSFSLSLPFYYLNS